MRHMEEMKIAGLAMALCIVMLGIYIVVPKDGTTSHLTAIPDNNAAQPVTDSTSQESSDSGSDEYFPIYTEDSYNSESDPDYSYDNTDNTDNGDSYTDGSNYDQDNSGDNYSNDDSGVSDDTGDTGTDDTPSDDNSDTGSDEVIDDSTDTGDTSDSDLGDDTEDTGSDDTVEVY